MLDVLVPHYNDPDGFELSLRSIEAQTWGGKIRVLVVDDGSLKENLSAVSDLLANSKLESELIVNEQNLGRPATRNVLVRNVKGTHVAWLDAGDEWYPDKIQRQFDSLFFHLLTKDIDPKNLWVTCHYDWKWAGKKARAIRQVTGKNQQQRLIVGKNLRAYLWTLLCPVESLETAGNFDEDLPRLQDLDYFLSFSSAGGQICGVEGTSKPLCVYHKSDIGRNAAEIQKCFEYIHTKHSPLIYNLDRATYKSVKDNTYSNVLRFALNNRNYLQASRAYIKLFSIAPRTSVKKLIGRIAKGNS